MNKFLEKYKEERESGSDEYKAFGVAASHIATTGTWEDLQIVFNFHFQDFIETTEREFQEHENYLNRKLTSYERSMKLAGHKQSDFM